MDDIKNTLSSNYKKQTREVPKYQVCRVFGVTIKAHCLKVNPSGFTVSYLEISIWNTQFSLWPCHSLPLVWLTAANLHQFETVWIWDSRRWCTVTEITETKGLKCFCWQVKLKLDQQTSLILGGTSSTCHLKDWTRHEEKKNKLAVQRIQSAKTISVLRLTHWNSDTYDLCCAFPLLRLQWSLLSFPAFFFGIFYVFLSPSPGKDDMFA